MTQSAYNELLCKTHELRFRKAKPEKHHLYVVHNPLFLHYSSDVYKIGYSKNVNDV